MSKSIISNEKRCFRCGTTIWLERHHIFGGAMRKKSEHFGLWVYLCHRHHNEPPNGVHYNRDKWIRCAASDKRPLRERIPSWTLPKYSAATTCKEASR